MTGEQDTGNPERLPANERTLVPFESAFARLRERFPDTTPGEVVMWVSNSYPFADGADREDVLPAYRRAVLPDDPEERSAAAVHGTAFLIGDTTSSLLKFDDLFFSPKALDAFKPKVRWLTHGQLAARWGCNESLVAERIQRAGNSPFEFWPHPLYRDAPLSESMFLLEQAEKIEKRLGLSVRDAVEKRARRGDDLAISDIVMLEFPVPPPREADREDWQRLIDLAVQCGEIPARLEVDDDGYLPGTDFIGRRDYLAWRNLQSDPPARSRIRIWQAPAPVEFFATDPSVSEGTTAIPNRQHIVESPEPDEPFGRPRTRNARPVGLAGDYRRWKRLDTHPEPDSLEWQARDGRLRVAIKAHRLRARLVPGNPAPGRSGFDEYTEGWWRDGTPPKDSPLLLVEGFWFLDGQEAFYVLRDGESRNINWLYPPDPAELHRLWPDLFPDREFYLDLESWKPVRREDLFWLDAPGQPATDPTPSAPALHPDEPDKPESGAAANKAALLRLLDELDTRAADHAARFNRRSLPGTKREFHKLLNAYHPPFRYMNTQNLADEYLKGKCQFQRGAKPEHGKGAAIWALFPEYPLK